MRAVSISTLLSLASLVACGAELPAPRKAPAQAARERPEAAPSESPKPGLTPDPELPRPTTSGPYLRPSIPIVTGPTDAAKVRAGIREHFGELLGCYTAALPPAPELAGIVTIEFTIDARGEVTTAEARDDGGLAQPRVAACMARGVSLWSFDAPAQPGNTEVVVSFELGQADPD